MVPCSCRTSALRIFLRDVLDVHTAAAPFLRANAPSRLLLGHLPAWRAPFHSTPSPQTLASQPSAASDKSVKTTTLEPASGAVVNPVQVKKRAPRPTTQKADTPDKHHTTSTKRRTGGDRHTLPSNKTSRPRPEDTTKQHPPQPQSQPRAKREPWQAQKAALAAKFPEGWSPRKRLSPDALAGIRAVHEQFPDEYPTEVLAAKFGVSPEAIRRILRSRWRPSTGEEEDRQDRWFRRGKQVWSRWAELGKKPPRRWRAEGVVRHPRWHQGSLQQGRRRPGEEEEEEDWDGHGDDGDGSGAVGGRSGKARSANSQRKLARSLI